MIGKYLFFIISIIIIIVIVIIITIIIGRNVVEPHSKKVFSTADIVCEGYLYKKGSWLKNW